MKKKTKDRTKRQAIVVLGMHRSGTSALSGTLSLLGCDAPNTPMKASDANAKGFFESQTVYELHRDLLESAGSMWSDWQPVNKGWFETVRAEEFLQSAVDTLEQEFGSSRLFFFKDPRVCRLVPFWLEALRRLDSTPLLLHIHRNPMDVIASLTRHHDLSDDTAMLLWLRHVLDAERFTRGMPRHFLSYDRFLDNWGREVARLQEGLDIILPRQSSRVAAQVNKFLESALRHFDTSPDKVIEDPGVAEWIRSTYEIMQRWAIEGEDPADHVTLDRILAAFDEATPVMNMIITNRENVRRSLIKFETIETDLRTRVATLEARISEEKAKAVDSRNAAETLKTKQNEADLERAARVAALESEIAKTKVEAKMQAAAVSELQEAVAKAERQLRDSTGERDKSRADLAQTAKLLAEANANWKKEQESAHQSALELESLEARLERMNDELELTRNRLLQREAELDSVRSDAQAEKQAQAALAEAHAEELARRTEELEAARQEAEAAAQAQAALAEAHAEELARRTEELEAARQEAASEKQARVTQVQELARRAEELEAARRGAEAEKQAQAEQAKANAEERSRLASSVASKRTYILELETTLSERFKETGTLTRLLLEAQQANDAAAKNHACEIEAQEQALTAEKAAHLAERTLREQFEHARQELLSSNSWRLTAPIRMITGLFRRSWGRFR